LKDIIQAIDNIERYAKLGRKKFENDELIQSWFIRHLQIIGESARALPPDVRDKMPDIPWAKIVGMRHILVHDYFEIVQILQLKFTNVWF
jgi:uncharacterized protein with HEPN domain